MSDLVTQRLVVTNLASSSGAVRLQVLGGNPIAGQWLVTWLELTAAQNAALSTALAAASGTVTNFDIPGAAATLPGISNSV